MPDIHLGIGATVGSVIPTLEAVIPAAVAVDICCGMMARRARLEASQRGALGFQAPSHPASEGNGVYGHRL